MRRGFLLSTPREPRKSAPATSRADPPPPSNKPSEQKKSTVQAVSSSKVIPLPTKYIHPSPPPDFPLDILQRTCHIAQVPVAGPPEQLTVFIHYSGILEALRAEHPDWPQPFLTPSSPLYKVVPIAGAGLGLVATADIAAGAVIVRERPLVLVPQAFNIRREEGTRLIVSAAQALHPQNKHLFYALKNVQGDTLPSREEGIVNTNAYTCGPFPAYIGGYGVLARDASRANHSCSPNAEHRFDAATLTHSLRAFRDIRAGEEITVTYVDCFLLSAQRQEQLSRRYAFTCACRTCRLPGRAHEDSDLARALIRSSAQPGMIVVLDTAFETWLADGTKMRLPVGASGLIVDVDPLGFALSMWKEMVDEGCYHSELWEPVLRLLVKVYSAARDEKQVRYYATKAAELRTLYTESDGGWRAVAENPRFTEWWGKRGVNSKV